MVSETNMKQEEVAATSMEVNQGALENVRAMQDRMSHMTMEMGKVRVAFLQLEQKMMADIASVDAGVKDAARSAMLMSGVRPDEISDFLLDVEKGVIVERPKRG